MEQWQPARVDLINYKKSGEAFWVDLEVSPVWDEARKLTAERLGIGYIVRNAHALSSCRGTYIEAQGPNFYLPNT